jgi:hypothetical protein
MEVFVSAKTRRADFGQFYENIADYVGSLAIDRGVAEA